MAELDVTRGGVVWSCSGAVRGLFGTSRYSHVSFTAVFNLESGNNLRLEGQKVADIL